MQQKPANSWADDNEDEEKEGQIMAFCGARLLIPYGGVCGCGGGARSGGIVT